MGACCVCKERTAGFETKSPSDYRTEMLIKYLKPTKKLIVKHEESSGDEGDLSESATSEEEEQQTNGYLPTQSKFIFPPSPKTSEDESPPIQPPLTRLSIDIQVKPKVDLFIFKVKRRLLTKPEVVIEPEIQEILVVQAPLVTQEQEIPEVQEVQEIEEVISSRDSTKVHYFRPRLPPLTPDLYERNMRGSLTREEELTYSPFRRSSTYSSVVQSPYLQRTGSQDSLNFNIADQEKSDSSESPRRTLRSKTASAGLYGLNLHSSPTNYIRRAPLERDSLPFSPLEVLAESDEK